jgi:predicted Ser/Thr protein kinase
MLSTREGLMSWIEEANKKAESQKEIHSYEDYMHIFNENPLRESRPTFQYLLDMANYFGKTDDGHYKIFQMEHPDSPPVFGQYKTQEALIQNLQNFQEEGFNSKFILLVGPNGSAKSSIVRKFIQGTEEYSRTNSGPLYTFSWIFPIDNYIKGTLGLATMDTETNVKSYAYLEDKDISAILGSEMKDHPLLLIPKEYRQEILEENLKDNPTQLESIKKSYLYKGGLSKRNRMIYDALLKNYKGKHEEVLKHIRVERFYVSKRYSTATTTIEPQMHVDAKMQQITMDKRLASLPPSLQSLNLFSMQGEVVLANRGILEYSDLLKRPLDTYKYLLMTMETGSINLQGIQTELDIFFVGTSNEIHLAAFKQHPDFNSFKGRFNFVKVPYLLNYAHEEKIYEEQVQSLKDKCTFEPHALTALCQFSVLTRLRACQSKHYKNKKLSEIVASLNPLEKATLLTNGELPDRLNSDEKQILHYGIDLVKNEFVYENLYEGKFGISPRDIKAVIYKLSALHKNITFIEVAEYLEKLITKKNDYDFLNMNNQGDYHHPVRFISLIKHEMLNVFDNELRDSLGLVDARSYEDYIKRYIENINAMIKGEKIKNETTGKFEECDKFFVKEFEANINLKEDATKYRSHLISALGAYSLDNPGTDIVYRDVFPDVIKKLQESFRNDQKKMIKTISKNLVYFETELTKTDAEDTTQEGPVATPMSEENRKQLETITSNLQQKFGYSQNGALAILKAVIKERY